MRQLITRLDEELLAKLKRRGAAEGRSVNALVNDILASQVAGRPSAEVDSHSSSSPLAVHSRQASSFAVVRPAHVQSFELLP